MAKNRINDSRRDDYDDFHESMSPTMTGDSGRVSERDVNVVAATSVAEQLVSALAYIFSALLAVRFFTHLFSNDTVNGFVNFMNATTDWLAVPFQALFQSVPAGTSGFFDIPAIAAIIVVMVLGYLINRLLASTRRDDIA